MNKKPKKKLPSSKKRQGRKAQGKKVKARKASWRKASSRRVTPRKPQKQKWLKRISLRPWQWVITICVWMFIIGAGVVVWYAWDIPNPQTVQKAVTRKTNFKILAANGDIIAQGGDIYGDPMHLNDLPPYVAQAFLATEDRRFYHHLGVDPLGVIRALTQNIFSPHKRLQGGSTITQQIVKNLYLSPQRTLRRKVQEAILAFWMESKFTKDQILEIYLNRIYLGAGTYGIDGAARMYFGVSAKKLTLYQVAVIAGLPKAPSRYNPRHDPILAARRANQVLDNMVNAGYLEASVAQKQKRDTVKTIGFSQLTRNKRYFVDWVLSQAQKHVDVRAQDVIIQTTLDMNLQKKAEHTFKKFQAEGLKRKAHQAALISIAPRGEVRAMLGGYDWGKSSYNRATQAMRQTGSVFKMLVYATAFEGGYTPNSVIDPKQTKGWLPHNYGGKHYGATSLRRGFAHSVNTIAVALLKKIGVGPVLKKAHAMGITAPLGHGYSLALGAYESTVIDMGAAYACVASGGYRVTPYGIKTITTPEGKVLYHRVSKSRKRVLSYQALGALRDVMGSVIKNGTGKRANIPGALGGKTGTTQNYRDAWFIGFSGNLTTAVWVGNDDDTPTKGVGGGGLPTKIWADFMRGTAKLTRKKPLDNFDGIY